jgi:hypothetical protein
MHTANNIIKDSCKVFKRSTNSKPVFTNRTTNDSVIASCKEFKIFPFITRADNPEWPWILSQTVIKEHDARLKNVLGSKSVIYLVFTQHLPYIYPTFTIYLPNIYLVFTQHLPCIYPTFTKYLPNIYHIFTQHLPCIYLTFTLYLPMIYLTFTQHLPCFYPTFTKYLPNIYLTFTQFL